MCNQNLVQPLEPRRLLAASFASLSSHGTLSVVGTKKGDTITIVNVNGKVLASLNLVCLRRSLGRRLSESV